MKITEVRRKFGMAIAIVIAISLIFVSCTVDSEDEKNQKNAVVQPAVTGLSAIIGDGKVLLSWTNPTNEEFSSLEVSYTTKKSSSSKKSL